MTHTHPTSADPTPNGRFDGKVAVVTGGNSGIGAGIARRLRREGARVAIFGRDATTLERTLADLAPLGPDGADGVLGVRGDLTRLSDLERLYARVAERFGAVDVLIANAGGATPAPVELVSEEVFDAVADVNFKGTYFTVQRALPHLADGASVVLVSSVANQRGMPGLSVYAAAKAAVRALARGFSAALLPRGIRVNVLSPGAIDTPMPTRIGMPPEEAQAFMDGIVSQTPVGRIGTPDDMAAAALFLASPEASFVAGAELVADGGFTQI